MKNLFLLYIFMLQISPVCCQEDGGFLCVTNNNEELPVWILRFKIIDSETHYPVRYANVELYKNNRDDGFKWHADQKGVAVFIATDPNCIPYEGIVEITSPNYFYHTMQVDRNYFRSDEDNRRIYLEGHRHNWTSTHEIPKIQEIVDKISAKRYQVGVKTIHTDYGVNMVNFAPACFEYEIQLNRVERDFRQPQRNTENHSKRTQWSDNEPQTPSDDYSDEKDCYVAYKFTSDQISDSESINNICRGKGKPSYVYSHAEYSVRNMGSYIAYDYECIYCK